MCALYFTLNVLKYTLATCILPLLSNGDFGDDCSEGQTIALGKVCPRVCDTDYTNSVSSVECISAGSLDASPMCTGELRLDIISFLHLYFNNTL